MTLSDLHLQGKRALVRVDFNVPLDSAQNVTDDTRIRRAIPTIQALLDSGASVVLMSHLGRPKGPSADLSLRHIVPTLSNLLGKPVKFAEDCVGDKALDVTQSLQSGEVALLENLRFHNEEKAGDEFFAGQLAESGDVYVNDAFGTAHRAHASTAVIAKFFPEDKAFGLLMQGEVEALHKVLSAPAKPLLAIIGGAKVSSKLSILENLVDRVDKLIVGGGMAYTFVKAQGGSIGTSLVEDDMLDKARAILAKAEAAGTEFLLPQDALCADDFAPDANTAVHRTDAIPGTWMGLDIGPESRKRLDFGDDDIGAHALGPHRDAAAAVAVAGDDEVLARDQDGRAAQDAVERRLAGAVVVDRYRYPGCLDALQRLDRLLDFCKRGGFGDLENHA